VALLDFVSENRLVEFIARCRHSAL